MAQLSSERIQKRLVDQGRFQLDQTVVLQDAEIQRLRSRLMALQTKIVKTRSLWEAHITHAEAKLSKLENRMIFVQQWRRKTLHHLKLAHKSRLNETRDSHKESMLTMNYNADRLVRTSELDAQLAEDDSSHDPLVQSIRNLSLQIERLHTEQELEPSAKQANKKIARKEIKAKAFQRRIEALSAAIQDEHESRQERQRKLESDLQAIQTQMDSFDRKISLTKSEFDSSITELTEIEQQDEPEELQILRQKLTRVKDLSRQIQERIETMQHEYTIVKHKLKDKRRVLRYKRANASLEPSQTQSIKAEIDKQKRITAELAQQLQLCDPELEKLHDENAELRRKLSEADYVIHGRTGSLQRLSCILRK